MKTIKTSSGDTWDLLAYRIWGIGADQAHMASLMEINPQHVHVAVFSANVEIKIPQVERVTPTVIPPWRR